VRRDRLQALAAARQEPDPTVADEWAAALRESAA
jgi:hypothetical protein